MQPDPGPHMRYPCPYCHAPADLDAGCTACGRPPDTEAAGVIRLDATIWALTAEAETARQAYTVAMERLAAVRRDRNALAARVNARVRAESVPPPPVSTGSIVGAGATVAPVPEMSAPETSVLEMSVPETSARTVQNVLFVLGGLLLGSAAVVFTAVAWANFGVLGRAAILAAVTVLTLAVGPLASMRRLTGTAETFAALGLLLVLLDGYAAWSVNLAGLADVTRPAVYAGGVCAVTAATAAGYGKLTGLTGPRYAALVVAQPVLPLLAATAGFGPAGWSCVFLAVAVGNLTVVRRTRPVAVLGWVFHGLAMTPALGAAVLGVATAGTPASAARSGGALVAVGVVGLVAALVASGPGRAAAPLPQVVAGAATFAVGVAVARVLSVAWPALTPVLVPATAAGLALAVLAVPSGVRRGPATATIVAAGLAGVVPLVDALASAGFTAARAFPAWHAALAPAAPAFDWRLPAALAMVAVALAVPLRRWALDYLVPVAGALLAFAVPASFAAPWWTASTADGLVAVPLLVLAVTRRRAPLPAYLPAAVAGGLAVHAVLAGLARPAGTTVVLGALVAVAFTVAALDRPARTGIGAHRPGGTGIGAAAVLAGLLALPGGTAAAAAWVGASAAVTRGWAAAGLVLAAAGLAAARRWWPEYALAGATGVGLAGSAVALAVLPDHRFGEYAALTVLLDVVAWRLVRRWFVGFVVFTGIAAVPVLVAALPATWTVFGAPYTWLDAVWRGRPSGVGLTPDGGAGYATAAAALTLLGLVLAVAAATVGRPARAYGWVAVAATPAILVGAAALGAPWPAVPALSLALAVTAALTGALAPPVDTPPGAQPVNAPSSALAVNAPHVGRAVGVPGGVPAAANTPLDAEAVGVPGGTVAAVDVPPSAPAVGVPGGVLAAVAVLTGGAGLAGALATPAATITGLGAAVVAAAVCGMAGRHPGARVAGWLVAVAGTVGLALSATRATGLPLRTAAFAVLGAAALALGVSAVLRVRSTVESRVVESAAHAVAVVALLLTVGSAAHAAAVCTLWGVALGLRALWPAEPPGVRRVRVVAATGCELLAYWLILATSQVTVLEAYTVPAAAVALLAGWLAVRGRPGLRSWTAYGPALLAGFGPSLAAVLLTSGYPLRRLALGVAAVAVVLVGSTARRQAPVVIGGAVLVLLAGHEIALLWDLLPRWIPLATAGLLLVGVAMTYERRRRDLNRLRGAVGRMT